jgi:hypothetical protein
MMLSIGALGGCSLEQIAADLSNDGGNLSISFLVLDKFGQPSNQFVQGDQATFQIIFTNNSDHDLSLDFTAPGYDITVYDKGTGNPVWASNYGIIYAQVLGKFNMNARETKTVNIEWNLTSNDGATPGSPASGKPLPVGIYEAKFTGFYGGVTYNLGPLEIRVE